MNHKAEALIPWSKKVLIRLNVEEDVATDVDSKDIMPEIQIAREDLLPT